MVRLRKGQVQLVPSIFEPEALNIPRGFRLVAGACAAQLDLPIHNGRCIIHIEPHVQITVCAEAADIRVLHRCRKHRAGSVPGLDPRISDPGIFSL